MINVTLTYEAGALRSLKAKGHADSAPYGQDLVCAAISAIVIGGLNALTDGDGHYKSSVKAGNVSLEVLKPLSEHDKIVLETIAIEVQSVASSYPENVKLERK